MQKHVVEQALELAREQRSIPTRAEDALWRDLRGRRCEGAKFRRQVPLGPYVADFVCFDARLIVELDGRPHEDPAQIAHDRRLDAWLRAQGFRILRFSNDLILSGSGEIVLDSIRQALANPSSDLRRREGHLLPRGEKSRGGIDCENP